ncbi:Ppef1 [Symbiodinium microadriaticum]|nr:Ppef1 [Symbiodinium sp. KB8]CAE7872943.1 Ppef1 [Symbiodinium microadriaticum]
MNPPCARGPLALHSRPEWQAVPLGRGPLPSRRLAKTVPPSMARTTSGNWRPAALAVVVRGFQRRRGGLCIALRASPRDSEGRKILNAPVFDASNPKSIKSRHTAEFCSRPFGVLAYAPSSTGKGAMVWELGEERYPGDPQGRARMAGVEEEFVVKAINGQDVSSWEFPDILDLLGDKTLDNSSGKFQSTSKGAMQNSPADLPVRIEFVQIQLQPTEQAPIAMTPPSQIPRPQAIREYPLRYTHAVDDAFLKSALDAFTEHAGQPVLSVDDALQLVTDADKLFRAEQTLQRVEVNSVVVVGDLHGQFYDLLRIFEELGMPSEKNPYLFNGDFVDRGAHSLEVVFTLLLLKMRYPSYIYMNRGNHEAADLNLRYGFAAEIRDHYGFDGHRLFDAFSEMFRWMPLAHVLNSDVFVVHGGLPGPDPRLPFNDAGGGGTGYDAVGFSGRRGGGQHLSLLGYNPDNVSLPPRKTELTLEDIASLPRGGDPATDLKKLAELPEDEAEVQRVIVDLLWADPRGKTGYGPSYRVRKGCYIFGPNITTAFLRRNGLRLMIRSHEVKVGGFEWTHPDCITVFSAPNYLGHAGNKGAVIKLAPDERGRLAPSFVTYEAQDVSGDVGAEQKFCSSAAS